MFKLISWFYSTSLLECPAVPEHDSRPSSPPSGAHASLPFSHRPQISAGSAAGERRRQSWVQWGFISTQKKMGKSLSSLIPHCLCVSLPEHFQTFLCPPTPHPQIPAPNCDSLLCEINFGGQISRGAPLSKAGFNSELNAMLTVPRRIESSDTMSIMRHKPDLKSLHSPGQNTG